MGNTTDLIEDIKRIDQIELDKTVVRTLSATSSCSAGDVIFIDHTTQEAIKEFGLGIGLENSISGVQSNTILSESGSTAISISINDTTDTILSFTVQGTYIGSDGNLTSSTPLTLPDRTVDIGYSGDAVYKSVKIKNIGDKFLVFAYIGVQNVTGIDVQADAYIITVDEDGDVGTDTQIEILNSAFIGSSGLGSSLWSVSKEAHIYFIEGQTDYFDVIYDTTTQSLSSSSYGTSITNYLEYESFNEDNIKRSDSLEYVNNFYISIASNSEFMIKGSYSTSLIAGIEARDSSWKTEYDANNADGLIAGIIKSGYCDSENNCIYIFHTTSASTTVLSSYTVNINGTLTYVDTSEIKSSASDTFITGNDDNFIATVEKINIDNQSVLSIRLFSVDNGVFTDSFEQILIAPVSGTTIHDIDVSFYGISMFVHYDDIIRTYQLNTTVNNNKNFIPLGIALETRTGGEEVSIAILGEVSGLSGLVPGEYYSANVLALDGSLNQEFGLKVAGYATAPDTLKLVR